MILQTTCIYTAVDLIKRPSQTMKLLTQTFKMLAAFAVLMIGAGVRADVIDDYTALTSNLEEATLNACAEKPDASQWKALLDSTNLLSPQINSPLPRRSGKKCWPNSRKHP